MSKNQVLMKLSYIANVIYNDVFILLTASMQYSSVIVLMLSENDAYSYKTLSRRFYCSGEG